jgi:nucleoid-associated protein YejK
MDNFKKFLDKKTLTPEQIATKHKKSIDYINQQLEAGIKVEMEHTNSKSVAKEIALDHLGERPDYYERLKKVE